MSLTASQLSALAAMKIPVWQQRTGNIETAGHQPSVQLSKTLGIMMEDVQQMSAAEQRLFQAILIAFQLNLADLEQLTPAHASALLGLSESHFSLLIIGPCPQVFSEATPLKSGALMLDNGIRLFVTDSLSNLLVTPARKAHFWQQGQAWLRAGTE